MADISVVTSRQDFIALEPAWNSLHAASPAATVFQGYDWHRCFIDAFNADGRLHILIARDAGECIAILPLIRYRRTINGVMHRALGFIGAENHLSDYLDLLGRPGDTALHTELLEQAASDAESTVVEFQNLRPEAVALTALSKLNRPCTSSVVNMNAYSANLSDTAFASGLLKKKSLKRHYNYFSRAGGLTVRHYEPNEQQLTALEPFFEQHCARRKLANDTSIFESPESRAFFRALSASPSAPATVRFTVIEHQGAVIACHYGFCDRGRFLWYKPSFDPALAQHSPGEVLLKVLLEASIAAGHSEFDFTVGDEAFKLRFSNIQREMRRVRIYRSWFPYALERARVAVGPVVRALRG